MTPPPTSPLPEHLPGEPVRRRVAGLPGVLRLLLRLVLLLVLTALSLPLWLPYAVAALIWGRPPNVPRAGQIWRYLRLAWTARPMPPGLDLFARSVLTLLILRKAALSPVFGLGWLFDEILYGRKLDATPVVAPLLEISAGRSGSTQLARHLEGDARLVSPSLLQSLFPYLWLWQLVPRTVGRFVSAETVRRKLGAMLPPEFLERHEFDPFRTDTFDGALYTAHLNHLCPHLGPDVMVDDFGFGKLARHNRRLWEEDFVRLLDRIARKTLLAAGQIHAAEPPSVFIKGHFLCAADALAKHYPDARFLTVIREPAPRLQSALNYLRANPFDPLLGPVPWSWLAEAVLRTETAYCQAEHEWFTRPGGPCRCVIRFHDFVGDLGGSLAKVYRECLDANGVPPQLETSHPPRQRKGYQLNRTLAQVGIDPDALNRDLAFYVAWCRQSAATEAE